MTRRRRSFAPFLCVALLLAPAPALAESGTTCPDNLSLERYPDLPRSARTDLEQGLRLHESALTAADWDKMLVEARKRLTSAARGSRGCMLPQYHLGVSYTTTLLFKEAEVWLSKAVAGDPGFYEAKVALAEVKLILRDFETALELSTEALAVCNTYRPAMEIRLASLIRLERYEDARAFLAQVPAPPAAKEEPKKKTADKPADGGVTDGTAPPGAGEPPAPVAGKPEDFIASLRRKLAAQFDGPGWAATHVSESTHYRVLTPVSKELADKVSHRAELIHTVYRKAFPKIKKPNRRYDVWVYADEGSYLAAGAPAGTAGYYDALFRRLVMYQDAGRPTAVYAVLQHEAFHQYLHDYLELAPSWFNEGLGDYFAGFEYSVEGGRETLRPAPNLARLAAVRQALTQRACPPAASLMLMSQHTMYSRANVHYPQSWALIYFIAEGKRAIEEELRRNPPPAKRGFATDPIKRPEVPDYMSVLRAYFNALHSGKNLVEAYFGTFGKLDMTRFESQWQSFIRRLAQ